MRYRCDVCRAAVEAVELNGREKVRRFRTGYVGRQLACGHWVPVVQPQIEMFQPEVAR